MQFYKVRNCAWVSRVSLINIGLVKFRLEASDQKFLNEII